MNHKVRCQCGMMRGHIEGTGSTCRVKCYCSDCQAFARYLGCTGDILDAQGGTEIIQIAQPRLTITQGADHLAAIQLKEDGLIRWYAGCCNTPLGNTLMNSGISLIGMIHTCLDHQMLDSDFGCNIINTSVSSAIGQPKPKQHNQFRLFYSFLKITLPMRIGGRYKKTPLFDTSGKPVVRPGVLGDECVRQLKRHLLSDSRHKI